MNAVVATSTLLRAMQMTDLPNVMAIEEAAYPFPWRLSIFEECLRVGYTARVLEADKQLMGYGLMSTRAGKAHILNLCVHPTWQHAGYGKHILEHLLSLAKEQDVQTVFLDVRLSNEIAIKLYDQMGFNQIGMRKNYYPNGKRRREHALMFALELKSIQAM
jgi:ribosomal-protein-alanine N-acetyltransferase